MPVLGMAQETGKIIRWLKSSGDQVKSGEPLIEIETDKAVAEIEAPGDGILTNIMAFNGDEVPVATIIAEIFTPDEMTKAIPEQHAGSAIHQADVPKAGHGKRPISTLPSGESESVQASPLARRIAGEQGLDLRLITSTGSRIEKADVLAYIDTQNLSRAEASKGRFRASPKARSKATEMGIDLAAVTGSGPEGAVLAADIIMFFESAKASSKGLTVLPAEGALPPEQAITSADIGSTWRIMAEKTTQSWQSAPHFYLMREVNASQFVVWRESLKAENLGRVTYTDLLVKIVAEGLRRHPRVNASWEDGQIFLFHEINIGLAVATGEGLVVPVIHKADHKSLREIVTERERLVEQAKSGRLRLDDISQGTFTLSNLGMYGVDVFNAIINPPQAAILAVGRIVERVVPLHGQPAIQPIMIISLSCDHRLVDGALGAKFLQSVAEMIEQPLKILN
jgi:pyruvate dehydrogenase E2 component (dihydrolipoamide acetyltransferase)